ncbi:phytanoyl-CoA dioxygenase family protein [Minwuia thermotolerans]|uniref:Proline hydroxylase n=1 Tax=Minwuia thermotolerans TaxID=2056226 RepID=A0A2M9G6C0_9PROT|nr:phytanoyl-CoA dioxygenase family protein [Minwuia thermotolerans]PJK31250.1 proline hydroxylase [Minwuia thermotolerans]
MKLTDDQLRQFDELGYLMLPGVFSADEMDAVTADLPRIYGLEREEVWRESTGAVRTAFAAHRYSEPFDLIGRHPRLVEPVRQLLGGDVYIHQYKINAKAAFDGDVWQWHQDYGTWARDDGMPEPRAMNIALFLDDVTEFNGPLWIIPGSHREGVLEAGHDLKTTSYPLWTLDRETITRLAGAHGIFSAKGKAGSVLMFHSNIVHASSPNIGPWGRTIVYLSLCHVDNHIREFKRPEWIAHRDFTAIETAPDDCLLRLPRATVAAE